MMHMCVGVSYINGILSLHQIRYVDMAHTAIHGHPGDRSKIGAPINDN